MKWLKNLLGRSVTKEKPPLEQEARRQDDFDSSVTGAMFNEGLTRGEAVAKVTDGANLVDGKQTWEHATEGKHDIELMKRCCEAELETYNKISDAPAPFYFWRVAVLSSKQKDYEQEVDYLQAYVDNLRRSYSRDDMSLEDAVTNRVLSARTCAIYERLPKAKARLEKHKTKS